MYTKVWLGKGVCFWPMIWQWLSIFEKDWWRSHFEKNDGIKVLRCEKHPKSREFWFDAVRSGVEACHPREMDENERAWILELMTMVLSDVDGFVSHFMLLAEKTEDVSMSYYF